MITRVMIFVALLVGGFLALYLFVDPQKQSAQARTIPAGATGSKREEEQTPRNQGVRIQPKDQNTSAIVFQPGGACEFWGHERIKLPTSDRDLPVYRFHALGSRSSAGNRVTFDNVTVDIYRIDRSDPTNPRSIKTSMITARRAEVELTRDEQKVLIAEDKLMEFWNLVYRETKNIAASNTKITIGHAQAVNTPDMIHLMTPDKDEPVRLETSGENGVVVTGNGLDAWIPSYRDQKGNVQLKAVGVRDVTVLSNPVLVRGPTTILAKGALKLKEDTRAGAVLISMRREVEIRSIQPARGKHPARTMTATGDSLDAVLSRVALNDQTKTQWRRLDLRGSPTHLSGEAGLDLKCGTLTLLPDISGEPFWITAEGTGPLAPVVTHVVDGHANTYRCRGMVHVMQVGRQHGYCLGSFGLTAGVPTEFDQLIVFEGESSLDSPKTKLHVSSSRGLTLIRSATPDLRDYVILRGRGDITVRSSKIRATGDQGFVLRQRPVALGPKIEIVREFRLGPEQPDTRHRYDIRKLADQNAKPGSRDRQGFHLAGSGSCQIRLRGELAEEVHLSSLAEDIDIEMTGTEGHLWQVRQMDAWFHPDGVPGSFVALGKDCRLKLTTVDDVITGKAEEIHNPATNTYRLVGDLAEAVSKHYGRLRGRHIFIQQLTSEDVRLRASHRAELHAKAIPGRKQPLDLDFDLRADEIRVEPFLVPPMALELYTSMVPSPGRGAPARYLFADGNVEFDYKVRDGAKVSSGSGKGDMLKLRSDRSGEIFNDGRLSGKPATIINTDAKGRKTSAASHLVVFHHDVRGEFITLEPVGDNRPELRLLDVLSTSPGGPTQLMMTGEGPIEMTPARIQCADRVSVRSLDTRGIVDPDGYRLDANSLTLDRSEKGEVETLGAVGDVEFQWADARGRCDELVIDVLGTILTVKGIARPATIDIPTGRSVVKELRYNYRTKMFGIWRARGKGQVITSR